MSGCAHVLARMRSARARRAPGPQWGNRYWRSLQGAEHGLTEEKIAQLDSLTNDFTVAERLAVEYAERLATDHHNIDDEFFDRLHSVFNDEQIVELGMMIGQFIGFGRLLMVLDLEPKFCAIDVD